MKELYVGRHGRTEENIAKIIQGWLGGTLSREGRIQARQLAVSLKSVGIEYILSGDLKRQRETAEEIQQILTVPVEYTYLLRERSAGELEGKTYAELCLVKETDFGFYDGDGRGIFATAESFASVIGRARGVVDKVLALPQRKILTIGSGWINSYTVNILLGEPFVFHDQENATVHLFKINEQGRVIEYKLSEDHGESRTS